MVLSLLLRAAAAKSSRLRLAGLKWFVRSALVAATFLISIPAAAETITVDGQFTGWTSGATTYEWSSITPTVQNYSTLYYYFDYSTDWLYVMNDWTNNTTGTTVSNTFSFTVGSDTISFSINPGNLSDPGDMWVNGVLQSSADFESAYGFGASPNESTAHTMYELGILLPASFQNKIVSMGRCDAKNLEDGCSQEPIVDENTYSPEPNSFYLFATGLLGLAAILRRKFCQA
jgi:hypothetical protein